MSHPAPSDDSPSFLDRKQWWGKPNYLLIAMAVLFVLAFVPRGVRKGIETNVNQAEDWLPADYPESTALRWFGRHYIGSKFILCSWDGCTLGEATKIRQVVNRLSIERDDQGDRVFNNILSGPDQVDSLTQDPSNLTRSTAIRRLEGALVGPAVFDEEGESLGSQSRTTCLVAYLSPYTTGNNRRMRAAIDRMREIVQTQAGVTADQIHLGGPPVDNITIDIEGEKTLIRLAGLSGIVGLALAYWCFRNFRLTWFVFSVAGISAGVSMAIVYWYGVFEITALGYVKKHLGTVDAILMSMPAVVYVLGLSGAIHIVNYYRDERDERGVKGAAERGIRIGWGPCALAALTTAVGLGSLGVSQIIPIKKFGIFTAVGVLATVAVLLTILPIALHRFPPRLPGDDKKTNSDGKPKRRPKKKGSPLPGWAQTYARFVTGHSSLVAMVCLAAMACFAMGLTKTDTQVQLLKLLDPNTQLIRDYGWFEEHLGKLVPMEVVIAFTDDHLREPGGLRDEGDHYRMSMLERMKLVERVQERVEALEPIGKAMSAATFGPTDRSIRTDSERRAVDRVTSQALEENREALSEYLVREIPKRGAKPADDARELWRISARIAALADIDYGDFVGELQSQVEPVLDVYRLRDQLLAQLKSDGKQLIGSRVLVVFDAAQDQARPPEGSDDALLYELLKESGVSWTVKGHRGKLQVINASQLRNAADRKDDYRKVLAQYDAVVTVSRVAAAAVEPFVTDSVPIVQLTNRGADDAAERAESNASLKADASLAAVYSGIVPLVYKTQRELLTSLQTSIGWATVLIACVMVVVLRSPGGGLVSMIPNVFPIVSVFGTLGWLGIKIDIGIMMTASVALGVAVDDTIHFLTWFRRGIVQGLDRRSATLMAFDRCAIAMTQTTIIAGLGLAVFATSTFTPTQQFGYLMITMLAAALVGDLLMLPALLCGPLGRFFAPGAPAVPEEEQLPTILTMPQHVESEFSPPPPEPTPATQAATATEHLADPGDTISASAAETEPCDGATVSLPEGTTGPLPEAANASLPEETTAPAESANSANTNSHPGGEPLSPANAALQAKLKKFRRS